MIRLFINSSQITTNTLTLPKEEMHHLKNVCKLKTDDEIDLICDETDLILISILSIDKTTLTIKQISTTPLPKDNTPQFTLAQALPKGDKMTELLRANTEIGVTQFIPLITERIISKPSDKKESKKQERWQNVIASAAMQTKQTKLPQIIAPKTIQDLITHCKDTHYDLCIVPWEECPLDQPLKTTVSGAPKSILVLIGPEGGLSPKEITLLQENGFKTCSLGTTILRTEHAGFYTIAQLQALI